ncbi:hypothetical protein, variant [Aphanomyces invadans]|uniref:BAR domain-containing protein n=1 Tax=Aphanomyces invadans TaxID=157072 RepID=A0A024T8L3_9STRA|nr:hypothetical protein H310_14761 [Aphanomyces invadans]XP_008880910.1 hypothetical protein, variant [Aphanomyces invadans]ETV90460.1 hypothetical protein H310_14761 [Aphanomyces invadans]ETV90461.1 hypothetical protein, variant [Aphanomyces invadans]|eukprot:XP_008880909.1 hypothetical protein H310_14761 [Aphanomyces invadans]
MTRDVQTQCWIRELSGRSVVYPFDYHPFPCRFNQQCTAIERLHASTAEYLKQADAMAKASSALVHDFKAFFNLQLAQGKADKESEDLVRQLAQASECLESIHWGLKRSVHDACRALLAEQVLKPITALKLKNANVLKNVQVRKQKMLDFDALRRATSTSSRPSPESQAKLRAAEESVAKATADLNETFDRVDDNRGYILRHEFLALTASQIFQASKSHVALQQLLPLMPGVAGRLYDLTVMSQAPEHASDPIKNAALGVLDYAGPNCLVEYVVLPHHASHIVI